MASSSEKPKARGFAADAGTERALRAGLSGRAARIQRGRFDVALRALAAEPASKLVFVDFEGVEDPEAAARELIAVCAFGTVLIAIGSTDTAHLARALLRQGVADYLVKPVSAAAVREVSAAALDEVPERTYAGRVVAFAGTGGSGVSTLIAAIARVVAAGGRTGSVVDLEPGSASLPTALGAEPTGDLAALLAALDAAPPDPDRPPDDADPTGGDPAASPDLLDGICAPTNIAGISLVAYPPQGPVPEAPPAPGAHALLAALANRAQVVLVSGLGDPSTRTEIMQQADARVLLYEPTLPSISAAVRCLSLLGPEHPVVLVQNHPRMRRSPLSQSQIRYALAERLPDVIVPFEPALHAAATGDGDSRPSGKAYLAALRQVIERAVQGPAPAER